MFLHLSVSHSIHGGHAWQGVACMTGETATAVDSMHPSGIHSYLFYVCMREERGVIAQERDPRSKTSLMRIRYNL